MDNYTATEEAYKNGYEKGYADAKAKKKKRKPKKRHAISIEAMAALEAMGRKAHGGE